jgi:alpha-beta hydrolase superfamily lysophospholipase
MSTRHTEALEVRLPGGHLRGHLSYGESPQTWAVCYVHGFGGVRGGDKSVALEAACARRGWTFAAFDFRGHGQSSGTMLDLRRSGLIEDLEAASALLGQRGIHRLAPVGSSMGGWAAAWFCHTYHHAAPACVLIAPAFRFPRGLWERLTPAERTRWERDGRLRVRNQWVDAEVGYGLMTEDDRFPPETLHDWRVPTLIYHGMRDDSVPYTDTLALVERLGATDLEVHLFAAGDHRLTAFKDQIAEGACDFFERRGLAELD